MEIYLMRHAEAVSASRWRGSDTDRPLSKDGIVALEAGAKEMKRAGFSVPVIYCSPYVRAEETATILSKILRLPIPTIEPALASGAHPDTLRKLMLSLTTTQSALFVGHNPEFSILGSKWAFEPKLLDGGLEPADMIAVDPGPAELKWGEGKINWWRTLTDWKTL